MNKTGFLLLLLFCNSCILIQKKSKIRFQWPIIKYTITQKYKPFQKKPHLGLDLKAPLGTPVLSVEKGRVIYSGNEFSGYGNIIMIEHGPNWTSLYAHLNQLKARKGQKIRKGEAIGSIGRTGRATGVHLHFELFYNKKNVNPLKHLP